MFPALLVFSLLTVRAVVATADSSPRMVVQYLEDVSLQEVGTEYQHGCVWDLTECQHGGQFLSKNCTEHYEQGQRSEEDDWRDQNHCICPKGYSGISCQLETPWLCKQNGTIFDGGMVNENSQDKKMECFVVYNDLQSFFALENHRVEFRSNQTGKELTFDLFTRPHAPYPNHFFLPMVRELQCNFSLCSFQTVEGDPHGTPYHWNCDMVHCVAAKSTPIIKFWLDKVVPPVQFRWEKIYEHGDLSLNTVLGSMLSAVTLELECSIGQCVTQPPNQNISQYRAYVYVTIVVVTSIILSSIVLSFFAWRANRSSEDPRAGQRLSRDAQLDVCLNDPAVASSSHSVKLLFRDVGYNIFPSSCIACCGKADDGEPLRRILQGAAGEVHSGEVMALLGLSGSGKTSLLDILAGRPKVGVVSGHIEIVRNGCLTPRSSSSCLPPFVAYMSSEEELLESQTVFETVLFSALLRLPSSLSRSQVEARVWDVIHDLGLGHIANTRVGTVGSGGVSSGERKRVSIAVELVWEPEVLFLDEPTSGLDSYNSQLLMEVISSAVKTRGLLCVLSIHQPPSSVYRAFDRVVLLTRTGRMAYSGTSAQCLSYFEEELGLRITDCKQHDNIPEFLLSVASSYDDLKLKLVIDSWANSKSLRRLYDGIARGVADAMPYTPSLRRQYHTADRDDGYERVKAEPIDTAIEATAASFLQQMIILNMREWRHMARKPGLFLLHLFFTQFAALALGLIYFQVDDKFSGVQDRMGFLFFVIFFFSLTALSSIPQFTADRRRFLKERSERYYSTLPYMLSKCICDILPMRVLPALLFGCISYFLVGLVDDPFHFCEFLVVVMLANACATLACFFASAVTPDSDRANLLAVLYFVFCMLFNGLLLNLGASSGSPSTPYIAWLRFLSFHQFAFSALVNSQIRGLSTSVDKVAATGRLILGDGLLAIADEPFQINAAGLLGTCTVFFCGSYVWLRWMQNFRR